MCVDMDAFFASVEQRDNPDLRNKPIAVTGAGERTVVTTSSYEARAFGVKTGMTTYEAKRLCPHIIFVTGHNRKYGEICKQLEEICYRFTPDLEIYSIDEVFLDIGASCHLFDGPENCAKSIKETVKRELGLTCTVGMAPNVLVAKLASDLAKPDGLRWIRDAEVAEVLETLPVKKLWGIGRHTEEKLKALGITTCGQLGRASASLLTYKFGILGDRLKEMGMGRMERPLDTTEAETKSISHSITLPADIWKREEIVTCILRLSERVGRRARRFGYKGRTVTVTVRYTDFTTFTRQTTVPLHTNDTHEIHEAAVALIDSVRLKKRVRLLGIALSSFEKEGEQMSLFGEPQRKKKAAVAKAVDTVNDKYGEHTVTFASTLDQGKEHRVISPAWRPDGVRKSDV